MPCASHCAATANHFDERRAAADRTRYQRRGPDPTTRLLLEGLRDTPVAGRTLLDIGGGIGVLGLELARRGLAAVHLVDAAPAYASTARELFDGAKTAATLAITVVDFVDARLDTAADLVTLDRVVCCYPDYQELLARAAAGCRGPQALSFPRDRWYVRLGLSMENGIRRLRGSAFRAFVHSPGPMAAILRGAGFELASHRATLTWRVEHWVRAA
jgi:magnesium-protoporphyrin O-methyltransferase